MKSINMKRFLVALTTTGMLVAGAVLPGVATAAPSPSTYTIHHTDTFWLIAQRLDLPLDELLDANPNVDPYNLQDGMTINLPGEKKTSHSTAPSQAPSAQNRLHCVATAYSGRAAENGGAQWAGIDYFGQPLTQGRTIAVDPNVIPLGSMVYVSGYNWAGLPTGGFVAQASDVGGAIQGSRIDIYLNGSAQSVSGFGMQNVQVTILK